MEGESMTAKQYLNRARRIDKEIEALLRMVQATRESLESITQNYAGDITTGTKNPHKFDRLVELESLVDKKVDELIDMKAEILTTIAQLKDNRQRIILTEYYLEMKTWEQVAVDMNYSWRQIMNIHGYSLQEVQRIINEKIA